MTASALTSPLLTICVPTYKRAYLLKIMLEALLPQAAEAGNPVEVWVLNNGSDDNTAQVVDAARQFGPLKYLPKPFSSNPYVSGERVIRELFSGEFLWLLGDHNLLVPAALQRILTVLLDQPQLDAFYVNFRCATYPEHWPISAVGGYAGPVSYLANLELEDRHVDHWEDLIQPESALCTQMYAHIFRRKMWVDYWRDYRFGEMYSSAQTTYPHTYMLAARMFGKASYYIGQPVITIFNGTQHWSATDLRSRVYCIGLPELIRHYARLGFSRKRVRLAREWGAHQAYLVLVEIFRDFQQQYICVIGRYLRLGWNDPCAWKSLRTAFMDSQSCWLARILRRGGYVISGWYQYLFHNCRPARWLRARPR